MPDTLKNSYVILPIGDSITDIICTPGPTDVVVGRWMVPFKAMSPDNITFVGSQEPMSGYANEGWTGQSASWMGTNEESPFVYDGKVDIAQYLSDNSVATPDIVIINLGTNDMSPLMLIGNPNLITTITLSINGLDSLVAAFLEYNENIKVIIGMMQPYSRHALASWNNWIKTNQQLNYNYLLLRRKIYQHFHDMDRVYLSPTHLFIDPEYDFTFAKISRNANADSVSYCTDGIHPNAKGYKAMAKSIFATLVKMEQ